MKTLTTEITIDAPVARVWQVLMNHEAFADWNPFIKKITGTPTVGETLTVHLQLGEKKPAIFKPKVLLNKPEQEFRWLGHLFVKGLFDGEHFFKLESLGTEQTRFIHGERFSGVLAGMILKMIEADTVKGFKAMNQALKEQAETK